MRLLLLLLSRTGGEALKDLRAMGTQCWCRSRRNVLMIRLYKDSWRERYVTLSTIAMVSFLADFGEWECDWDWDWGFLV